MRFAKGSTIYFSTIFTNSESENAIITGIPVYSVWYYKNGIIKLINGEDLSIIDGSVYGASFVSEEDAIYIITTTATFDDDSVVSNSKILISGTPLELGLFVSFADQCGENILNTDIENAQFRVLQNNVVIADWDNLTYSENGIYYGVLNADIDQGPLFVEFKMEYDGLNIVGSYIIGGSASSGGSGAGASARLIVKPNTSSIKIGNNIPNVMLKTDQSNIKISTKEGNVVVNPSQSAKIKI